MFHDASPNRYAEKVDKEINGDQPENATNVRIRHEDAYAVVLPVRHLRHPV